MIDIVGVTKRFPSVTALNEISLSIREGEFYGLLGPNGAGKSTLMNLLIGYLDPDAGNIFVMGDRVSRDGLETRKRIGYIPQSIALYDELSAEENLQVFGSFYHLETHLLTERIIERLKAVELYDRRRDKVRTYSGGMKRRLNLVAGMLHDPPILLCDELTVGVDPQSRNAIFDYLLSLNRMGKTIIYTTHYMEEAERLCNRIAIIDFGKIIAEGTLDELMERLTYEETISIRKNESTSGSIEMFRRFGTLTEEKDRYVLKPGNGFKISEFFAAVEQTGIKSKHIELQQPTLEALFLQLTGRRLRD